MPFKLSKPSPGGGDRWSKDDHLDHLMVFAGDLSAQDTETSYGDATAAHCDYIVCVDCPQVWSDQLVFGAALVPRLTGDPDATIIVGRLGQGLAKPGKSAPWTLDDPTDADLAKAEQFLESYATYLPSGTLVIDVKAIEADRPDTGDDPL